jgi:hypothetical protein
MQLLGLLFVAGAMVIVAKYVLIGLAIIGVIWLFVRVARACIDARERRERELDAIRARADEQHRWTLQDDPRGLYGDYPPAI